MMSVVYYYLCFIYNITYYERTYVVYIYIYINRIFMCMSDVNTTTLGTAMSRCSPCISIRSKYKKQDVTAIPPLRLFFYYDDPNL